MSDEEKSARARELWRILRRSVRNYIIFARLLRPEWKNLGQDLEKEDLGDGQLLYQIAWFQLDPRNSKFLQIWVFLMTIVYWFDILMTPIIIIFPVYIDKMIFFLWATDACWICNIFVQFLTTRLDMDNRDPQEIAIRYARNGFVLDIVATLPPLLSGHHTDVQIFRAL